MTAVVDDLVAVHSSDPVTVYLSIGARLRDPSIDAIESALYEERSVVRHHAMRRTLWVMTPGIAQICHSACTTKIAAAERRRTVGFLDGDEPWLNGAIEQIVDLLSAEDDPLPARDIGERLPQLKRSIAVGQGTKHETTVSGHSRALLQAAFEGRIVRTRPLGSWTASQYAWANTERWIDIDWTERDTAAAQRELVGLWLERFGPGTLDDIVWWTGMTKTSARKALDQLDTFPVELSAGPGLMLADDSTNGDEAAEDPGPWVALLPSLDATTMGWKRRDWYLDPDLTADLTDFSGNIGPTIWADGRIVGVWAQREDGTIAVELVETVSKKHRALLDDEVDRLLEFVGSTRFRVRFPPSNQPRLLG